MARRHVLTSLVGLGLLLLTAGHAQAADRKPKEWQACGDAPVADAACLHRIAFTVAEAREHLADKALAFWTEGTRLRIVARTAGEDPWLCCTFQDPMVRLEADEKGTVWGLEYDLPHLDESVLSFMLLDEDMRQQLPILTYSGARAGMAPAKLATLKGHIETMEIDSGNLGEKRKISVYIPAAPPPADGYPVIYMADGDAVRWTALYIEKLIDDGSIRPVLLVGMWPGNWKSEEAHRWDRRNSEYLPGANVDPAAYAAHEAFVLKEVMPLAESRFYATRKAESRLTYGFSSGASWSLSFALRHPDLFRQASGFAVAASPDELAIANAKGMRVYTGAGAYDPTFGKTTHADCDALVKAGADCTFISTYSGHDMPMWTYGLVGAATSVFGTQK